jgi:uncharacterized membrane protein
MRSSKLQFCCAAAAAFLVVQAVDIHLPLTKLGNSIHLSNEAWAKSSGGRSRGGSFKSRPSSSSSSSSDRSPASNSSSRKRSKSSSSSDRSPASSGFNQNRQYNNRPSYNNAPVNAPVVVPVPAGGSSIYNHSSGTRSIQNSTQNSTTPSSHNQANQTDNQGSWIVGLIVLAILGGVTFFVVFLILKAIRGASSGGAEAELDNDTVTISKIQVALLAQARSIQTELSELVENYDPETPEGLLGQLQETALALLRTPENWSHVQASSQAVKGVDEAQQIFEQLSIAERSKFSAETLVRVGGNITRHSIKLDPNEAPAAYIVVTLLVGTAYDQPLFTEVRTSEQLTAVLEKVASMPPNYLMVFELLWSPQDSSDSLTYDELLTEYADMVQL